MFVRESLTCTANIESTYYSATRIVVEDCCIYCGKLEDLDLKDSEYIKNLLSHAKIVRPICNLCRAEGLEAITWGTLKISKAKKAT